MSPVFILGVDDPEMRAIVELLSTTKQEFGFAAVNGSRCHPGNAHNAMGWLPRSGTGYTPFKKDYKDFIFVECRPFDVPLSAKQTLTFIDHHEEGDPGYSLGPSKFWEASSLGQTVHVLRELGHRVDTTYDMRVIAAMVYCRPEAMFGKCPGVKGEDVFKLRVKEIAADHKTAERNVRKVVTQFGQTLKERTSQPFGNGRVIDLTDIHLGSGYSLELLCAQTALDVAGLAGLLRHHDKANDRSTEKISISGHVTPEMVTYFEQSFAPNRGLVRVYGVPARGFAGGYLA